MQKFLSICALTASMLFLCGAGTRSGTMPATKPATTSPATTRAATGPVATKSADGLDLQAKINGINIRLPNDWNINASGQVIVDVRPSAADKDGTGEFTASLVVAQGKFTQAPPADMVAVGTALQAQVAKQEGGYQIVEKPAAVTIGGIKGVKFGGTFKRGAVAVRDREYYLITGTGFYKLSFTSLASKWAGYQGLVEKSVASFSLAK